jgi:hypothetical protein
MSRFADPSATRTVDLGECLCPGAPHASDWVKIRGEASSVDVRRFAGMGAIDDEGVSEGIAFFISEWNLLGPNGEPWAPSGESVGALKLGTLSVVIAAIGEVVEASILPNGSGAPSVASSRGSASPTRKRTRKPTT